MTPDELRLGAGTSRALPASGLGRCQSGNMWAKCQSRFLPECQQHSHLNPFYLAPRIKGSAAFNAKTPQEEGQNWVNEELIYGVRQHIKDR